MKKKNKFFRYGTIFLVVIILLILVGFYFKGITGNVALANYLDTNYSAPYNLSDPNDYFFKISSDSLVAVDDVVNLSVNVSMDGGYIYQKGYVFNQRTHSWEVFNFNQTPVDNSYWIKDFASQDLVINVSNRVVNSSETYVVAYACYRQNGQWKCGCQSADETNCKRWMLHTFNITNITISPDINCTDDANCTMTHGTCDLVRKVCVSEGVVVEGICSSNVGIGQNKFFFDGDGSESNPFGICSCEQLQNVGNSSETLNKNYILTRNINCVNTSVPGASIWDASGFKPIGNITEYPSSPSVSYPFIGNFNGAGFTISNLNINKPEISYVGLFGYSIGNISNVNLLVQSITGFFFVGGLVGVSDGPIINSHVTISKNLIGEGSYAGGLAGESDRSIDSSSATIYGTVSANWYNGGGLVGSNLGGIHEGDTIPGGNIYNSFVIIKSGGEVLAERGAGGLVGYSGYSAEILNSSVMAEAGSRIMVSTDYAGGFLGSSSDDTIVSNSSATIYGTVSANTSAGGFIGRNYGIIFNSSATILGTVSVNWDYAGGFCGINDFEISDSYSVVSGNISVPGSSAGGFTGINYGGSISNSYSIISSNVNANSEAGGFVGYQYEGTISNSYVTVNTQSIISGNDNLGGLVGYNYGTISNSSAIIFGNISAQGWWAGGLAGYDDYGEISNSYSNVEGIISAGHHAGGFVGSSSLDYISDSYSIVSGKIIAADHAGGFVGYNNFGVFSNLYVTGNADISGDSFEGGFAGGTNKEATNCYWNNETIIIGGGCGVGTCTGVTGRNTTQMKTQSSYNAAWSFSNVWAIDVAGFKNNGYPYLRWQVL